MSCARHWRFTGGNGAFMELSELSVEQVHFGYSVGCVCVCDI